MYYILLSFNFPLPCIIFGYMIFWLGLNTEYSYVPVDYWMMIFFVCVFTAPLEFCAVMLMMFSPSCSRLGMR